MAEKINPVSGTFSRLQIRRKAWEYYIACSGLLATSAACHATPAAECISAIRLRYFAQPCQEFNYTRQQLGRCAVHLFEKRH